MKLLFKLITCLYLTVLLNTTLFLSAFAGVETEQTLPNIILIQADDLGWTDLGSYGNPYFETPNIDRIAAEGVRFTQAYAAAAVCSPSRFGILTGRYPARSGLTDYLQWSYHAPEAYAEAINKEKNPSGFQHSELGDMKTPKNPYWMEHEEMTIAEFLKEAGYTTAHVGKWHLGPKGWWPESHGFDYNIGGTELGLPGTYFDPYAISSYAPEGIETLPPRRKGEYLTDRLTDEAVKFIETHREEPFFLYFNTYAVHTPLEGRKDLVEKYRNHTRYTRENAVYGAMVEAVDEAVGKILETVHELNLEENTLILFVSDNGGISKPTLGPFTGEAVRDEAPLRGTKGYPYEGGIRIPLIMRWAGKVPAGRTIEEPVIGVDIFPTLVELIGEELPKDRPIDGESLVAFMENPPIFERNAPLFWHYPHYRNEEVGPYSIIREGDWKLIRKYDKESNLELYNLKHDLSENKNLAPAYPDKIKQLSGKLDQWLEMTGARLPEF